MDKDTAERLANKRDPVFKAFFADPKDSPATIVDDFIFNRRGKTEDDDLRRKSSSGQDSAAAKYSSSPVQPTVTAQKPVELVQAKKSRIKKRKEKRNKNRQKGHGATAEVLT